MSWIVYFLMLGLEMPEGFSARFHAKFPDRDSCERWVAEIEATEAETFSIISECQPENRGQKATNAL